jgi:ribosomal protein S18 acetylase RimI-like enzyme
MSATMAETAIRIRSLAKKDLDEVVRIDALHTGEAKREYWQERLRGFLTAGKGRVGLAAEEKGPDGARLAGYVLGEIRAFEFGSMKCGWIFAVGVDPENLRNGVASCLLEEACRRFGAEGVGTIRTMVGRNDVPVLSFFRSRGFVGGPFVQLEHLIEDQS